MLTITIFGQKRNFTNFLRGILVSLAASIPAQALAFECELPEPFSETPLTCQYQVEKFNEALAEATAAKNQFENDLEAAEKACAGLTDEPCVGPHAYNPHLQSECWILSKPCDDALLKAELSQMDAFLSCIIANKEWLNVLLCMGPRELTGGADGGCLFPPPGEHTPTTPTGPPIGPGQPGPYSPPGLPGSPAL